MMRMMFLSAQSPDVANSLRIWDQLAETGRAEASWRNNILDLSAAGRWEEAADFFRKQIERIEALKLDPQPALYACAAASLRKAGRDADADAQDAWVEKLALGRDAAEIANGYAFGQDYTRASEWWARAARQCDPTDLEAFSIMLQLHSTMLIEQGKWKEVASVSEVRAQMAAGADSGSESPLTGLRLRLQADLGRALGNLKADRAGSIAMLEKCQAMFPCDGSLADDFFPALRQVGLIKEHDQWFKESWDRILAVVDAYPESDNTANTAGWLASRAQRNLNQAQKLLERALTLNPDQPPYLDTMAEIQFAKGNREKALEWSTRAVNFKPLDSMIRRQQERFRSAPLPR